MWARSDNDRQGSRPIILRPYTRPGPGRLVQAALLLAFMGFCLFFGFLYGLTTPFLIKQLVIPIVLLALVAVWALPDVKTAPTGALYGLSFAFVIVLFLWPNYLAVALPGLAAAQRSSRVGIVAARSRSVVLLPKMSARSGECA